MNEEEYFSSLGDKIFRGKIRELGPKE